MKVRGPAGIELVTPGSAVRHASVVKHVTDYATQPGLKKKYEIHVYDKKGHVLYK